MGGGVRRCFRLGGARRWMTLLCTPLTPSRIVCLLRASSLFDDGEGRRAVLTNDVDDEQRREILTFETYPEEALRR